MDGNSFSLTFTLANLKSLFLDRRRRRRRPTTTYVSRTDDNEKETVLYSTKTENPTL